MIEDDLADLHQTSGQLPGDHLDGDPYAGLARSTWGHVEHEITWLSASGNRDHGAVKMASTQSAAPGHQAEAARAVPLR